MIFRLGFEEENLISKWISEVKGLEKHRMHLIYRGSRDGFNSFDFHNKCDGSALTLTLIKSDHD